MATDIIKAFKVKKEKLKKYKTKIINIEKENLISFLTTPWSEEALEYYKRFLSPYVKEDATEKEMKMVVLKDYRKLFSHVQYDELSSYLTEDTNKKIKRI